METEHLSLEQQEKLEKLKINLDFLKDILLERSRFIMTVASLSAMILAVATFNGIVKVTIYLKSALSVLLFLIMSSVWFFLFENNYANSKTEKSILDITGMKKLTAEDYSRKENTINKIFLFYPWCVAIVLSIVIIYIICAIWLGF